MLVGLVLTFRLNETTKVNNFKISNAKNAFMYFSAQIASLLFQFSFVVNISSKVT